MKGKHTLIRTLIVVGLICICVIFVLFTSIDILVGYPIQKALLDAAIRSIGTMIISIPFIFILRFLTRKKNTASKTGETEKLN